MIGEIAKNRQAVVSAPAVNVYCMRHAAINTLGAGFGMGTYQWVQHFGFCIAFVTTVGCAKIFFRFFSLIKTRGPMHQLG